jgi:hypothetical protein
MFPPSIKQLLIIRTALEKMGKMGSTPTIFLAEMYALKVYTSIYLEHEGNMSDSQAALRVVRANAFNSKLIAHCLDALKRLFSVSI